MMLMTGALHEDGLADVVDGFWGGHTLERKLAIMRDSAIGTYGTLALIVVTGLRWMLWTTVLAMASGWEVAVILVAVCSLSRGAMLVPWVFLPPVRPSAPQGGATKDGSGLSVRYGQPNMRTGGLTILMCLPFLIGLLPLGGDALAMLTGLALAIAVVALLARHHIGGHTGDVLGATQQMAEVGLLFGFALAM